MKDSLFKSGPKKILIVGGAGYVGLHLSNKFVDCKSRVTIITPNTKKVSSLCFIKNTNLLTGSVMDYDLLKRWVKDQDVVINLVGFKDEKNNNPIKSLELNCLAELKVLESIVRFNPSANHIFAGTRAQFGKINRNGELIDEGQKQEPQSIYGLHKKTCEDYLRYYNKTKGLEIASLRLVGIYGPAMMGEPKHFVSSLVKKCLSNEDIFIRGNGSQIQDFLYIDDLTHLIQKMVEKGTKGIYNAGSGKGLSMKKIAKMIKTKCKSESQIFYQENLSPEEDYSDLDGAIMDISKIKGETGWEPQIDFSEGVNRVIEWYKRNQ